MMRIVLPTWAQHSFGLLCGQSAYLTTIGDDFDGVLYCQGLGMLMASSAIGAEMETFLAWFNRAGPSGPGPLPALTRAGTAHLYFESIRPFEDGDGRIGRAISEKALAQALGRPTLTAVATTPGPAPFVLRTSRSEQQGQRDH